MQKMQIVWQVFAEYRAAAVQHCSHIFLRNMPPLLQTLVPHRSASSFVNHIRSWRYTLHGAPRTAMRFFGFAYLHCRGHQHHRGPGQCRWRARRGPGAEPAPRRLRPAASGAPCGAAALLGSAGHPAGNSPSPSPPQPAPLHDGRPRHHLRSSDLVSAQCCLLSMMLNEATPMMFLDCLVLIIES